MVYAHPMTADRAEHRQPMPQPCAYMHGLLDAHVHVAVNLLSRAAELVLILEIFNALLDQIVWCNIMCVCN